MNHTILVVFKDAVCTCSILMYAIVIALDSKTIRALISKYKLHKKHPMDIKYGKEDRIWLTLSFALIVFCALGSSFDIYQIIVTK